MSVEKRSASAGGWPPSIHWRVGAWCISQIPALRSGRGELFNVLSRDRPADERAADQLQAVASAGAAYPHRHHGPIDRVHCPSQRRGCSSQGKSADLRSKFWCYGGKDGPTRRTLTRSLGEPYAAKTGWKPLQLLTDLDGQFLDVGKLGPPGDTPLTVDATVQLFGEATQQVLQFILDDCRVLDACISSVNSWTNMKGMERIKKWLFRGKMVLVLMR